MSFQQKPNDPSFNQVFFPYWNKYSIYHNIAINSFGFSQSPHFGNRKTYTILAVIDGLERITNPEDLIAALNIVKLHKKTTHFISDETLSLQISLFPELFAI